MSIPRAKAASPDLMQKAGSDINVADKSVKSTIRKPIPLTTKSKIPKQGKGNPTLSVESDNTVNTTITADKDENKPATPSKRPVSRNQEKTASTNVPKKSSVMSSKISSSQKRLLENQFSQKKKRYTTLKRDIEDKQKSFQTTQEELFELREKILASGGKDPGKLEDLLPLSGNFLGSNKIDVINGAGERPNGDKDFIGQFETNLRSLPDCLLAFCQETIDKHNSVITWLGAFQLDFKDHLNAQSKNELSNEFEGLNAENNELQDRLEIIRQDQVRQINELAQYACSMYREIQLLRQERENFKASEGQLGNSDDVSKELRTEKDKLLKARSRIRDQDSLISNLEGKLRHAQEQIKHLENQVKQKDTNIEQKNREISRALKANESNVGKYEKQKEGVESRVSKLREQLEFKDNETKTMIDDYKQQIVNLRNEIENERETRDEMEKEFEEIKARNAQLEEKCKQLLEIHEKKRDMIADEKHTEYEIQLFNDLKETQRILFEKEELIKNLQIEREEIMAAVDEVDQENDSSKKKLSAELFKKSDELQTVKSQFNQLQKNYKRLQQKTEHLERKLSDMERIQSQFKDGSRANYGAQVMQLQQQVTDLRSSLAETNMHNSELEKTCTQLQLKLEHYKRYVLNCEKDMKVRREVQQLLHLNTDNEASSDQGNMSSINAQEFEQLYGTLESKEMQIMKLEKLVKQMEKQDEYSQAQRTRLENRIAKLELALKEGQQAHRNRGFSFL